ncbi:MAG: PPOX class F420-dependent oxidoreductase [Anaerolinea sp.]|nr:PPOX class F420-dependent oxidoreductase [Anaerolinea sp.]MCC6976458.1 PPOX class F420-dependent oxidoreductase [Anaerolineae bacterium]
MSAIPDHLKDLFSFERPIVCALGTVMPSGQPQLTPVWFDYDGTHLIINTARGRQKDRNMTRNAKVTILILDPQNPMHWAEVRGYVDEATEVGGHAMIKRLALKYRGKEEYNLPEGQVRVTYKIAVTKVNGN